MPINPTYPGVYVEEIPSGVHTITGVSTSVTAFLGTAIRGPVDDARHVFSFSDYERYFGGLSEDAMSYAVNQFFLNGGTEAWIVRLVKHPGKASLTLNDSSGHPALRITALDAGQAANDIQVRTQANPINPDTFDIQFVYASKDNPADSRIETFKNVSLDSRSSRFVENVINDVSQLVTVKEVDAPKPTAATPHPGGEAEGGAGPGGGGGEAEGGGTPGGAGGGGGTSTALVPAAPRLPVVSAPTAGNLTSGAFDANDLNALPSADHYRFKISLDGDNAPAVIELAHASPIAGADLAEKLGNLATSIQSLVRAAKRGMPAYRGFTCTATNDNKLVLASPTQDASSSVVVTAADSDDIAGALHLLTGTGGTAVARAGTSPVLTGGTGEPFTADEAYGVYIGSRAARTGIYALESVDIFNLMCLPGVTDPNILADAIAYCKERRAFLIVDAPTDAATGQTSTPQAMSDFITGPNLPKGDYGTYAAIYYPWVKLADPLNNGKLRSFPPSPLIAGLYARTDSSRGVWKAPAGTEAVLVGVRGVDYPLTDLENGSLNQHGVNCLRVFPVWGPLCWGARTVSGDDQIASEYKYVPIRRFALYIEESLYRGLKWVVFEPNDEPLWAQIRLNVGAFMHNLFRQGAFQGQTPREAYFVKCDKETTTQNDIDLGIVNIVVGFAPLKPAEFVILKLQQIAGQIEV